MPLNRWNAKRFRRVRKSLCCSCWSDRTKLKDNLNHRAAPTGRLFRFGQMARISRWPMVTGQDRLNKRVPENTKAARRRPCFFLLGKQKPVGAGEAIRTPDPNLGKVMLYP